MPEESLSLCLYATYLPDNIGLAKKFVWVFFVCDVMETILDKKRLNSMPGSQLVCFAIIWLKMTEPTDET